MNDIEKLLSKLSPEKRRLLELKLKKKGSSGNTFPLSYAQQRLWFLDQLEPGSTAYNLPAAIRLKGSLHKDILEKTFYEIVKRHEILRTTFSTVNGTPMQITAPKGSLPINHIDISSLKEDSRDDALRKILKEENAKPFNLTKGPLLFIHLIRISETEHVLFLIMHHIISDGWSVGVFVNEFSRLYSSFLLKQTPVLPELPIQYADFAVWQKEKLNSSIKEQQLAYWKEKLGGSLPVLELPTDHPRPAIKSYRGNNRKLHLSGNIPDAVRTLSQEENTTSFMLFLSIFYILLYRYTDQNDICVGTPVANRRRAEIENLIGFFVNTLVLRANIDGTMSFQTLLQSIKNLALEAFSHEDLPFEMLVEELQPERDMGHTPVFQVMFVYQNARSELFKLPQLQAESISLENDTAKFDLTLTVSEMPDELLINIEYDRDLFEAETIDRMLKHYEILLTAATEEPGKQVAKMPLISEQERYLLLKKWVPDMEPFEAEKCVHEVFEEQAAHFGGRTAITYNNQQITYRDLNAQANQIARYLIRQGVQKDELVGIYSEREPHLTAAILGVLKAGAAYLPIDPVYPPERVAFMLDDANVKIILTQKDLVENLNLNNQKSVLLDENWPEISKEDIANPQLKVSPQNLIYVIYTSGSTGKPKGTLITHHNVMRLFQAVDHWFNFNEQDVWTLFHSYAFDFSVWEIWGALLYGGRLVIVPQMVSRSPESFYHLLIEEKVTVLNQTPSAFRQLITAEEQVGKPPYDNSLRFIIFGGEALELNSLKPWYEKHTDTQPQLINMYGITETTVHVTYRPITLQDIKDGRGSVIGKPIPDLPLYILDSHSQPAPIGIPGEIHVSGAGLARGYLNRPELTSTKFIPNPFSDNTDARLYRSGDAARYLPDGDIEYIGRMDNQVKIRGFRIELGEIQTLLNRHDQIRGAFVNTVKDAHGANIIAAYLVPKADSVPSSSELRAYLREKLPDYMIPSAFVMLDEFPLTANGKIDLRALPNPSDHRMDLERDFIVPRSAEEEITAQIFSDLLNITRVGAGDHFFDLGGHSLLATQLLSRIRDSFGVELPLKTLFERPTVEALAGAVKEEKLKSEGLHEPAIIKTSRSEKLPLSFAQQRLWFLDQLEPGSPFYNIPSAYKITGKLNIPVLKQSLEQMVERHEILRTFFKSEEGKAFQLILNEVAVEIPIIDLTALTGTVLQEKVQQLISEEARKPFNLSTAPLFRTSILKLDPDTHILLLTMHHIISDGWSMQVFIREMAFLYKQIKDGQPAHLPPQDLQYADYAAWQRDWLQGDVLEKQLAYWKKQLSSSSDSLSLPAAKHRPTVQTYQGAHLSFDLTPELSQKLHDFSREQGATLFMTTLAAFNVLLFRYSGQDDINIGTPIANRNRSAVENILGFFVNTLVLRTDLSGNPSFIELVRRVKETALGAYSHQDVPFEKLLDAIQTDRDLSRSPLFQVMFTLQNAQEAAAPSADFNLEFLSVENNISQFDLTLTLFEKPDGISGGFEYNTDIFDKKAVDGMIRHFKMILEQVLNTPQLPASAVKLLDPAAHKKITAEWNNTAADLPQGLCIHHLFEKQATKTPDAPAVKTGGKAWSYARLNESANILAQFLHKKGVVPGSRVGICTDRSFEMIAGLLGILKSGAAYVPLDPNYPDERISFMIKDAELDIILTQQHLMDNLPESGIEKIALDNNWQQISAEAESTYDLPDFDPENTAYIIYTSGSTGTPKGVLIPHRAVVNHNIAAAAQFGLTSRDRVLQFATINFDSAVEEIFPALNSGALLVLRGPEVLITGAQLIEMIEQEQLTVIDLPTAYWHQIVRELEESEQPVPASLRLVILGGDKINPERFIAWNKIAGKETRLLNTYGPTETTIISTAYEASEKDKEMQTPVDLPIGRPLPNTTAYVLDSHLQPVPPGIPGELFTGGMGLAQGYLKQPALTAEKFIPDPFSTKPGARLYRTGDLVCFRENGLIDFLGRVDQQVKIRGFRVETGEIENLLNQHPEVKNSIVIPRTDSSGTKRLAAYFISSEDGFKDKSAAAGSLRSFAAQKLPDYMVPAAFVQIDKIPYTPSGKIDTRSLPEADDLRSGMKTEYVPPESENEKILAEIMQEILGQKKIGVNDNFFELGGDSILSIQVIARAGQKGLQITPVQMFKYQTIAQLALVASTVKIVEAEQGLVLGEAPLTPIQHWFFEQDFQKPHHWNQSLLFKVNQRLEQDMLQQVTTALLTQHDVLRSHFIFDAEQKMQKTEALPEQSPFIYFDGTAVIEAEQRAFIEKQCARMQASFNLSEGPLFKVIYFDFGSFPGRLLLIIHHLVVDGVSWRIILEDFQAAYQQISSGQPISLPRKTTSFKEWAEKLNTYSLNSVLDAEKQFWLSMSKKTYNPIIPDIPDGINSEESVQTASVTLTENETKALLQDVPPVYNTQINDILLSALVSAYARWDGKRSLLINLEGHGREEILEEVDISRTVGWFTTLFPVYLELGAVSDSGRLIKHIKEELRKVPNKGIGYGLLRYLSQDNEIRHQLSALDKAPVSFNYLGQFDQALQPDSILSPAEENKGVEHDPREKRSNLIDITSAIAQGKLTVSFAYSKNQFHQNRIKSFSEYYLEELQRLIKHCKAPEAGGHTASDFELAGLDNKKLDKVMAQLKKGKKRRKK